VTTKIQYQPITVCGFIWIKLISYINSEVNGEIKTLTEYSILRNTSPPPGVELHPCNFSMCEVDAEEW
jgi:hypothetical protein